MPDTNDERPIGRGRLSPLEDSESSLNSRQLQELEQAFRRWATDCRPEHRRSRLRILLIFLLIRYTGARLNEVLSLDLCKDVDEGARLVRFCKGHGGKESGCREVQIPETIASEIRAIAADAAVCRPGETVLRIDPAHVRRKFYEQAAATGLPRGLGAPESIRKSRAVELMRSNMPLPVVQKIMGHSTPNLTASYVDFSEEEIRQVARYFAERENNRKTSARNAFFGKVHAIRQGEVQTLVEVVSLGGHRIASIITSDSLARIGLQVGMLVTAEVKAPWIQLCKSTHAPKCSAENMLQGKVLRIKKNRTTAEIVVQLADTTELCAVITEKSRQNLAIREKDLLWAFFDAFAVILHVD